MDEITAWTNFVSSGRVEDYLIYSKIKTSCTHEPQEDVNNADQYRRFGYYGAEYRRK